MRQHIHPFPLTLLQAARVTEGKESPWWKALPAAELNQAGVSPSFGGAARICFNTVTVQMGRTAQRGLAKSSPGKHLGQTPGRRVSCPRDRVWDVQKRFNSHPPLPPSSWDVIPGGTASVGEENLPHYFCIIVKITWRKETFLLHTSGQR